MKIVKSDFIQQNNGSFKEHYQIGQMLGQGAFGEVRKCLHRDTKATRAVKLIKKESMSSEEEQSFKHEISILKKLDHPNILKLYEVFEDDKRYYLVTEMCKGGELFDEIVLKVQFSEKEAATIIQQILQAVAYCHELGIVHRDLKPENALIDKEMNNTLKIIDFGTAIKFERGKELLNTTHGTSYYIAPEVLSKSYDEKCDVWSIGVIFYILLSGKPPFDGENDEEIIERVKLGKYSLTGGTWQVISAEAKALLKKMLTYSYDNRISARQALADPWFKNAAHQMVGNELMKECMANMFKFSATSKMQQATLSMMVNFMMSKEETARLQQVFSQLDINKDGKLQYDEVLKGYTEYYSKDNAKSTVDRIFELVDADHSQEIDFSEFVTATANRELLLKSDKLRQAFDYFDKDKSGSIDLDEIKQILGGGQNLSDKVWK